MYLVVVLYSSFPFRCTGPSLSLPFRSLYLFLDFTLLYVRAAAPPPFLMNLIHKHMALEDEVFVLIGHFNFVCFQLCLFSSWSGLCPPLLGGGRERLWCCCAHVGVCGVSVRYIYMLFVYMYMCVHVYVCTRRM
eukprot:GHVS01088494.1.p3 GENE.GHVS01088494.1~~GHVS01088494.1.p3  ORF type:complete len:134 (+),score=20.64 GHVS01088494.1:1066-1467(+)